MPAIPLPPPRRDVSPGGFPWGGLLALLLALLGEPFVFGVRGPWDAIAAAIPAGDRDVDGGAALDQLAWAELARPSDGTPRAVIVGSSRAASGLLPALAGDDACGDVRWLRMAHPGIEPYQIRSFAGPLARARPELVVLLLSEFDTHRPLRLVPRTVGGDVSAVAELAAALGPSIAFAQRESLLRFTLGALWPAYRLREPLRAAGLASWCTFERFAGVPRGERAEWPLALDGDPPRELSPRDAARVLETIRARMPTVDADGEAVRNMLGSHQTITRGPQAAIKMGLVRSAVEILASAGVRVLVVEGPLCPFPVPLYDLATRAEFRELAAGLARLEGVAFLPLEESGPFLPEDFHDPNHLGPSGAERLTRATCAAARALLAR